MSVCCKFKKSGPTREPYLVSRMGLLYLPVLNYTACCDSGTCLLATYRGFCFVKAKWSRVEHATCWSSALRRWLQLHSTAIRSPFDSHSTAVRPRYDHSTTYITTVKSCCTAVRFDFVSTVVWRSLRSLRSHWRNPLLIVTLTYLFITKKSTWLRLAGYVSVTLMTFHNQSNGCWTPVESKSNRNWTEFES